MYASVCASVHEEIGLPDDVEVHRFVALASTSTRLLSRFFFFRARLRRVSEQHAHASQTSHFLDTIKHVPFRLVTCELYTLSFVQLASAQVSQSKLCLGSFALCLCGEQLMMHMSMRQHELVLGIV